MSFSAAPRSKRRKKNPEQLLWRMSPDESFSDWTIQVVQAAESKNEAPVMDRYFVHKCFFGVGEHKSEMLAASMRHDGNSYATVISLTGEQRMAAESFPDLLDFVYSGGDLSLLIKFNVTPLYFLAEYMGIASLKEATSERWAGYLGKAGRTGLCESHARMLQQDDLLRRMKDHFAAEIFQGRDPTHHLFNELVDGPEFLMDLLSCDDFNGGQSEQTSRFSMVLSKITAQTAEMLEETMTLDMFQTLTSNARIPTIDFSVATKLLSLEESIACIPKNEWTSLKHRCFDSMESNWSKIDFEDCDCGVLACLMQFPSEIVVRVMAKFCTTAVAQAKLGAQKKSGSTGSGEEVEDDEGLFLE